ncbi:MAG: Stk1 family PASTA domain-containing Ser/Thr kinase [Oscillospiraceae bacterium]|nr:Stk1 family PASTA domain-containing Ser/Thr kinase [Oscillospiraceae bacterium]
MDQYIGKMLDNRYELLELIGKGGMANVYKAKCHRLNRLVAVKILKSDLAENADFRRRFRDESLAVAQLSHTNIVSVYDVSRSEDLDYIVMELIDGITLKQYMERRGTMDWREALHFITQIMRGLSHAHSRGIIHRDIKPQNIMVLRDGSVKVADFGIACLAGAGQTLTQEALGSVHYISPEQARGDRTDERSDIYSAGVVLYEMLTGRLPFEGDSAVSVAIQHLSAVPLAPRDINSNVPEGLELITMKAMNPNPNKRYPTADAMLDDLERFRKDPNVDMEHIRVELEEGVNDEPTQDIPVAQVSAMTGRARGAGNTAASAVKTKEKEKEDKKRMAIIIGAFAAALLLVFVIFKLIFSGMSSRPSTDAHEVPDLLGYTVEEAMRLPEVKGIFEINQVGTKSNPAYEPGEIVEQDPAAGRTRKSNLVINVFVCAEEEKASMPTLTDMDEQNARVQINNLNMGLKITVTQEFSDTVEEGKIIRTEPAAGEDLKRDDSVRLIISKGKELKPVTVISFINRDIAWASDKAKELGLDVKIKSEYDMTDPGTVFEQSIEPGFTVDEGTEITLTVSLGPKTVKVDNYVGLSYEAAKSKAEAKGLRIYIVERRHSDTIGKDCVIHQNPAPDTSVADGSTVEVVVSLGPDTSSGGGTSDTGEGGVG